MIGEHAGNHRFPDRYRADADARVVASFGHDLGLAAVAVDGAARGQDRGGGFYGEARDDRLAGRDAAEDPAGMVRQEPRPAVVPHADLVSVLLAGEFRGFKSVADLDPFDRVDAHQRRGEIGIELAVDRRAEPRWNSLGHDLDHRADRGALLAHAVDIIGEEFRILAVGTEKTVALDLVHPPARADD